MTDVETSAGASVGTPADPVHVQGGIKRTLLQKTEFPDGYVLNTSVIEVPAGTSASPHTHPGIETGYVIGGEFYLCVEGQPDQHHVVGSSYTVPADAVHYARVPGPEPLKVLCFFVVNQSQPLATVERAAP
ncbi:cupin domain-containing protein [Amycolatopsis sp. VS8301801F10]|uniref:cupin domain-containing protein n=1 Tax=Amycolatopsis sp. VS8301801F10 TaxID=2652442 RepID=UPI0038FC43BB